MTNVIILGQEPNEKKDLTPIKLDWILAQDFEVDESTVSPKIWKTIELVCKDYKSSGKDLMFGYNHDRNKGSLFIGHFNDGIV